MCRIAIVGGGGWGTALGIVAGHAGHEVRLWSHNTEVVDEVNHRRVNSRYLGSYAIPDNVKATTNTSEALHRSEIVILASPSHTIRELLTRMLPDVQPEMIFVSATKGIEIETGERISEVLREVLCNRFAPRFVCLSGPSFAQEVAAGHPTAVVAASSEARWGALRDEFERTLTQ